MNNAKNIIEFLRGKTIIDKISFDYELPILERVSNKLSELSMLNVRQEINYIEILFQPNFLISVKWPYYSAIEDIQLIAGKSRTLNIYAHQLFEDDKNYFALKFKEKELIFENRKNIEDTLFLDLKRYCDNNRIHYKVR